MTIILFLLILAVLVFVHELGHFLATKFFGIRVDEFAIGFPPRIFSVKRGETTYALNLIPFGGYVKIFGENPDEDSMNGADSARSLVNAKKWKQVVILLAGVFMNIIFAWILISITFNIGLLTSAQDQYGNKAQDISVMVLSVLKDSPADTAGMKEGDVIIGIQSATATGSHPSISGIQNSIAESSGALSIEYKRGAATGTVKVIPASGIVEGKVAIGISMGQVATIRYGFFASLYEGAKLTGIEAGNIASGIYNLIAGAIRGDKGLLSNVAGPVGIASMVAQAQSIGISYLLGFIALISINLAVLNVIPFPAFDGGRVFFILIEAITRRKIKPQIANWINLIGFALIILLMIFITYKDIARLIG